VPDLVEINKEDGIIEIKSFGVLSQRDFESSVAEVNRIKNETGVNKVLVDTREQELVPDITTLFKLFSESLSELKVAMFANKEQSTLSALQFSETVAHNRKVEIKIFFLREAALVWLNK
jgi:hypothetical protein